jgi:hypothetical protein
MKITFEMLKKLVAEQVVRIQEEKFGKQTKAEDHDDDAEEVEADGYADTLEKPVNHYKALKKEEARLHQRLATIAEQKKRLARKIKTSK